MRAIDIIIKKRDHQELTQPEIEFFVRGFARGDIPDYQVSAWAMAVLLNGMTPRETTFLTLAMAASGETLDLSGVVPFAVDKHSTGGVGDKTALFAVVRVDKPTRDAPRTVASLFSGLRLEYADAVDLYANPALLGI